MIDTHVHLQFPGLSERLDQVLTDAKAVGVATFIVPGTGAETSAEGVALTKRYDNVFAAVGIHPTDTEEPGDRAKLRLLMEEPKVVAIGEVGLDYFHPDVDRETQKERFAFFLREAKRVNLPVIIHCREAGPDLRAILKAEHPGTEVVIHCFTGDVDEAKAYLDLGCHLSFTNILTYPKNGYLREAAAIVPDGRFMVETDAPYLPPAHKRGELCEPKYVRNVAECLSEVRQVSLVEIDRITTETAQKFFRLP